MAGLARGGSPQDTFDGWVLYCHAHAQVVELADTGDLKSPGRFRLCGFESRLGHCVLRIPCPVRRESTFCGCCWFARIKLRLIPQSVRVVQSFHFGEQQRLEMAALLLVLGVVGQIGFPR